MTIKGAKTIAEYAIRRWMAEQNFAAGYFELTMNGNEGTLTDRTGDSMVLVYDSERKAVYVKEE